MPFISKIIFLLTAGCVVVFSNENIDHLNGILSPDNKTTVIQDDGKNYLLYERLSAHMRLFEKHVNNLSDAVSYYRLEDSYLDNSLELVNRIRELLMMKKNPLLSAEDKKMIDTEIMQFTDEFIGLLRNANFNSNYYFRDILSDAILDAFFYGKAVHDLKEIDEVISHLLSKRSKTGAKISRLEIMLRNYNPDVFLPSESKDIMKDHLTFLMHIFSIKTK